MLIDFDIKNRWTGQIQFTAKIEADESTPLGVKIGLAVKWAINARANLSGANLSDANLSDAYLSGANLSDANLSGANLSDANLSDAYLSGANLSDANLSGANLSDAYLSGANLSDANLSDANLSGANLSGEQLRAFKADMWLTLSEAKDKNEVRFLIAALRAGAVDGSSYGDGKSCACLVGTLARFQGEDGEDRDHNANRPAERWFLMIKVGDFPGKTDAAGKETGGGFAARKALEWALEWCDAAGLDPEFPADPTIKIPAAIRLQAEADPKLAKAFDFELRCEQNRFHAWRNDAARIRGVHYSGPALLPYRSPTPEALLERARCRLANQEKFEASPEGRYRAQLVLMEEIAAKVNMAVGQARAACDRSWIGELARCDALMVQIEQAGRDLKTAALDAQVAVIDAFEPEAA